MHDSNLQDCAHRWRCTVSAPCAVTVIGGLIVIVIVTPVMVFGFVPLAFIYMRVQQLYIATSRELKRLDSLAFSPIFSHLNESLQVGFFCLHAQLVRCHHSRAGRFMSPQYAVPVLILFSLFLETASVLRRFGMCRPALFPCR